MSRLPLVRLVGATIIVWGAICMCLAAPTSFAGFAATRFLLGAAEGAVSPAFVTLSSIWYRKREHATRIGCWITMNGLAQVVGCLLMYGIGKNAALALAPWRTLFLVCGALTSFFGVCFYALMPGAPEKAWFLTAREKEVLVARLALDREGGDKTSFSTGQLKEAMADVRAWFSFAFGVLVCMQSPVLTVSFPLSPASMIWEEMITDFFFFSSPPSSSRTSATQSSRPCSTPRPRAPSRSS